MKIVRKTATAAMALTATVAASTVVSNMILKHYCITTMVLKYNLYSTGKISNFMEAIKFI